MTGALTFSVVIALSALLAVRPPRPPHSGPWNLQFGLGYLLNEQPYLGLWLLVPTLLLPTDVTSPLWWLVVCLRGLAALAIGWIALRARSARPVLTAAFETTFGKGAGPRYTRPAWWRFVLLPLISWRIDVRRIRNRRYGPAPRAHRLDVYVSRRQHRANAPVLVYFHGGGFLMGSKMLGARPLIYRLAGQGWICVSADYRLRFRARYHEQLADARAAIEWVRTNAEAYGGSPSRIFVAGGSAGAHLATTAALSGTEVNGVIALYGYYGNADQPGPEPASPQAYVNAEAPPTLIIHGALDTLVLREDARAFANQLREVSRQPVVYAELPGTQHNFDFFHSWRFHSVTDAIAQFARITTDVRPRRSLPPQQAGRGRHH